MAPVYWIEDEIELLSHTRKRIEQQVGPVTVLRTAREALNAIPTMKAERGPLIGSMFLPADHERYSSSPMVGVKLMRDLVHELGSEYPVFILSGSVSIDLFETLQTAGISTERIFTKPLLDADSFIESIANALAPTKDTTSESLGLVIERPSVIVFSRITADLLMTLRDDPMRLRTLTPGTFEELIAERIEKMGFSVTLTGSTSSKDGGVDLVAVPKSATLGSILIAGQVKHHSVNAKTGIDAVDRLLAWRGDPFHLGLLITNTEFTDDAKWKANQTIPRSFIRLRDLMDLQRWLHDDFSSPLEARELPTEIQLRKGLTITIPKLQSGSVFTIRDSD